MAARVSRMERIRGHSARQSSLLAGTAMGGAYICTQEHAQSMVRPLACCVSRNALLACWLSSAILVCCI